MQVNQNGAHDDRSQAYPEESIGRLMTSEFVAVRPEFTVAEALSHIRRHGKECETLNTIYVVDKDGSLIDEIDLSKINLVSLDQRISELVGHRFTPLAALEDQELAIRQFQGNDAVALPVVDGSGTASAPLITSIADITGVVIYFSFASWFFGI